MKWNFFLVYFEIVPEILKGIFEYDKNSFPSILCPNFFAPSRSEVLDFACEFFQWGDKLPNVIIHKKMFSHDYKRNATKIRNVIWCGIKNSIISVHINENFIKNLAYSN